MSSATTPAGKPPPRAPHGAEETLLSITISTSVEIDAPKQLVWDVLTDFSAYPGEHVFILDCNADGSTHLTHGERYSGVLVALARPFLNKERNQAGYEGFNQVLKQRVESVRDTG